jgi:hypothetical protein
MTNNAAGAPCLVLSDGSLPALVAIAHAAEAAAMDRAGRPLVATFAPGHDPELLAAAQRAVQAQAEGYGLEVTRPLPTLPATPAGLSDTRLLLDACALAAGRGVRRVIWPVALAGSPAEDFALDAVAAALDRALLVGRLANLDIESAGGPAGGVRIETPFADLQDDQLADLAADMAVPIRSCWWASTRAHPLAQAEAERWGALTARLTGGKAPAIA